MFVKDNRSVDLSVSVRVAGGYWFLLRGGWALDQA